jgi:hypothetical protein
MLNLSLHCIASDISTHMASKVYLSYVRFCELQAINKHTEDIEQQWWHECCIYLLYECRGT